MDSRSPDFSHEHEVGEKGGGEGEGGSGKWEWEKGKELLIGSVPLRKNSFMA